VFTAFNFSILSNAKIAQVTFVEKPQMKIISFWKQNHGYLFHTWQSYQGNRFESNSMKGGWWIGLYERWVMNRTLWKEGDESDSMKGGWWIGLYERRVMNRTLWKEGDESDSMKGGWWIGLYKRRLMNRTLWKEGDAKLCLQFLIASHHEDKLFIKTS